MFLVLSVLSIAAVPLVLLLFASSSWRTVGCIAMGCLAIAFLGLHSWDEVRGSRELVEGEHEGDSP